MRRTGFSPTIWAIIFFVIVLSLAIMLIQAGGGSLGDLFDWGDGSTTAAERRDCRSQLSYWCAQEEHQDADWQDAHPNCVQYKGLVDKIGHPTKCPVDTASAGEIDRSLDEETMARCQDNGGRCMRSTECEREGWPEITEVGSCGEGTVCCDIYGDSDS